MSNKKIYFMGILANTDSSILKVNPDHGFKIGLMSENEGVGLISILEGRSHFELSYQTHDMNLSLLSLMISLEILFHPGGQGELNCRISRNAAALLGKDRKVSNKCLQSMVT